MQRGLEALGYEPPAPDGMFGPRTREAIRAWQSAKRMEPTGYLTKEQAATVGGGEDGAGGGGASACEAGAGDGAHHGRVLPDGKHPGSEQGRDDDERRHRVCVEDFSIGRHEVTRGQYAAKA